MTSSSASGSTLAHRPPLTIRELDHLDYLAKIRHWLRKDPWSPGGAQLRFENPIYGIGDLTIVDGNITRAKTLVGRPCFGIATALLRYEHATRFVKGRGLMPTGRCHNCKAKGACRWVVDHRLKAAPPIEAAWTQWLQEGGAHAFARPQFKRTYAYRCWLELCRALQQHPFESANDEQVAEAYLDMDVKERGKDKERKAKARRDARRRGEIDEADEELFKAAARRRAVNVVRIREDPGCPSALAGLPTKSVKELMEVWLGREIVRARMMKENAPNIARWIVQTGRSNTSKNHEALSSRVVKDLQRIAKLERLSWQGAIVLPPLDRQNEFPSALAS